MLHDYFGSRLYVNSYFKFTYVLHSYFNFASKMGDSKFEETLSKFGGIGLFFWLFKIGSTLFFELLHQSYCKFAPNIFRFQDNLEVTFFMG